MAISFWTEDEPEKTRLDCWQHVMASALAPYQIQAPGGSVRSRIQQAEIGQVNMLDFQGTTMTASRTTDLIRKSDLGMWKIDLNIRGRGIFEQDGRESALSPGEFLLVDLSRPSHVAIEPAYEGALVMFPRSLLPVRYTETRDLTAVRFSARDPYAALVISLVRHLHGRLDTYESARDTRISTAFLDLLTLAIAARHDRASAVPPESRQRAMALRIQAFIDVHLGDPTLSPGMIAAAHHISVRTLHKLYEAEELPITASIRRRRLERCRQDLLNLSLRDRPVSAVGARWGFPDAATFSRAFRQTYGLPPGEYQAAHADGPDVTPGG